MQSKRVLFIGIGFYDYEDAIIRELEKKNFVVDYFSEFPKSKLMYLALRFNLKYLKGFLIRRNNLAILLNSGSNYDYFFVIKGEYLTKELLNDLRTRSPKAKFILYLWDSVKRIHGILEKFSYFDLVFSFDRIDAKNNSEIIFHPLFYRFKFSSSNQVSENYIYDAYFLGLDHSDRFEILKALHIKFVEFDLKSHFLLYTGRISFFLKFFKESDFNRYRRIFTFKTISADLNYELMSKSKCVVDISHPDQSGLTMRTLEIVASGRKMITTNLDVVNYDFYDPENILILDRKNPRIEKEFFTKPYKELPTGLIQKYSISSWIDRIFN